MAFGISSRTGTIAWLAASGALHVAVVLGVRGKPAPRELPPPVEVELELDTEPAPVPVEATAPTTDPVPAPAAAIAAPTPHAAANAVTPSEDPGASHTEAAAPVASSGGWSVSAFRNPNVSIYQAPNYAAMPAPSATPRPEATAPAQVSQTGGLREALASKDQARGLGRGGSAVSAAHQASNDAPSSGHLVLALTFDASGAATSVHIAERSDGDPSWDQYAQAVLAYAKKKGARALPEGAKSMVVTMSVDSRMVLPSGSAPGSSTHVDGLSGTFDLADLGAGPKKRVTAKILKEQLVY